MIKPIPLYINFILLILHICMVLYVTVERNYDETNIWVLDFYYSYTVFIVLLVVLNTIASLFLKTSKQIKFMTLVSGVVTVLFYIFTHWKFNPF